MAKGSRRADSLGEAYYLYGAAGSGTRGRDAFGGGAMPSRWCRLRCRLSEFSK